jgi:hypothetical protein
VVFENKLAANDRSDQMGVELGKVLAKAILAQLNKPEDVTGHDSSVRISASHLHPFSDTEIFRNRRPVLFTTTRSTGRNRCKRKVVYEEARKTVTLLKYLSVQTQKVTLGKFNQRFRLKVGSVEREKVQRCTKVWLCA